MGIPPFEPPETAFVERFFLWWSRFTKLLVNRSGPTPFRLMSIQDGMIGELEYLTIIELDSNLTATPNIPLATPHFFEK